MTACLAAGLAGAGGDGWTAFAVGTGFGFEGGGRGPEGFFSSDGGGGKSSNMTGSNSSPEDSSGPEAADSVDEDRTELIPPGTYIFATQIKVKFLSCRQNNLCFL